MIDQEQVNGIARRLTLEYIAGFFDGEGSITYSNRQLCSLQIVIGQTDHNIIAAIGQFFGTGSVKALKVRRGHKQNFEIRWCGQKAKAVLEKLEPYLVVKQQRARLGIQLASLAKPYGDHSPVSPEVQHQRQSLTAEISRLNDSHWSRRSKNEKESVTQ